MIGHSVARGNWRPPGYKPPMLTNRRHEMGNPAVAAAWPWIVRIGGSLLLTAGAIYGSSALLKAAVPTLPINTRNVPKAAIFGGLGVASYFASSLLPEKYAALGYVGAALGVGGAIYTLFKDAPLPSDPNAPTPAASPEAYANIQPIIESPKRGETTSISLLGNYPVRVMWINSGDDSVPFNYRLNVTETPSTLLGRGTTRNYVVTPKSSNPELKPINRLNLLPKDSLLVEYDVPIQNTETGWVANNVDLKIEVFNPHARAWQTVAGPNSFIVRRM